MVKCEDVLRKSGAGKPKRRWPQAPPVGAWGPGSLAAWTNHSATPDRLFVCRSIPLSCIASIVNSRPARHANAFVIPSVSASHPPPTMLAQMACIQLYSLDLGEVGGITICVAVSSPHYRCHPHDSFGKPPRDEDIVSEF